MSRACASLSTARPRSVGRGIILGRPRAGAPSAQKAREKKPPSQPCGRSSRGNAATPWAFMASSSDCEASMMRAWARCTFADEEGEASSGAVCTRGSSEARRRVEAAMAAVLWRLRRSSRAGAARWVGLGLAQLLCDGMVAAAESWTASCSPCDGEWAPCPYVVVRMAVASSM